MSIQQLKDRIGELDAALVLKEEALKEVQEAINSFEYTASEDEFNAYVDANWPEVEVMGMMFSPSRVLQELDETAWRCEKANYESSYDIESCDEYIGLQDELAEIELEIAEINAELDEANEELETLTNGDDDE